METNQSRTQTAYVSIDIDYWANPEKAFNSLRDFFCALYQKKYDKHPLWQTSCPTIAVMNHQQMLPHVNSRKADVLVNVDTHSDICDEAGLNYLNCGTWVSYVKWRKKSDYLWIRSNEVFMGSCNHGLNWKEGHGWKSARTLRKVEKIDLMQILDGYNITGVGICMSPQYIAKPDLELVFRQIVKMFRIPYRKGRRNEDLIDREVRPPKSK